jgi:murein DD-endopeptidase MepM/ murein hydrolase activator NlpD
MAWLVDAGAYVRGLVRSRVTEDGRVTPHWGLDVSGPRHTPVRAVLDGTFLWNRRISGYGITVAIRHSDELSTFYAHLNEGIHLSRGDTVTAEMIVGRMGDTTAGVNRRGELVEPDWAQRRIDRGRRVIDVHLHWEVHPRAEPAFGENVERLDPERWLEEHGIPIVKPEVVTPARFRCLTVPGGNP